VEVGCGRVGGVLYGEFEVGVTVGFWVGEGGRGGYGEAASFGEGRDEGVEPLTGEELGLELLDWTVGLGMVILL
jgi:hypothetical protein